MRRVEEDSSGGGRPLHLLPSLVLLQVNIMSLCGLDTSSCPQTVTKIYILLHFSKEAALSKTLGLNFLKVSPDRSSLKLCSSLTNKLKQI